MLYYLNCDLREAPFDLSYHELSKVRSFHLFDSFFHSGLSSLKDDYQLIRYSDAKMVEQSSLFLSFPLDTFCHFEMLLEKSDSTFDSVFIVATLNR
jgi:hypothetical protein